MVTPNAAGQTPGAMRVGPYTYRLGFDQDAAYDFGFLGICHYKSRRIQLDPRQADTELPLTVLHEAIHALGDAYGIDEWSRHNAEGDGPVDRMASALLVWMRDNRPVVEWLTEGGK